MNRKDYNRNFERYRQNRESGRQGRRGGSGQGSGRYSNRGYGNQGYYAGRNPDNYNESDYSDYYNNERNYETGEYGSEGYSGRSGRDQETGYTGSRFGQGGYQNSGYSDTDYSIGNYSTRNYNRDEEREYGRGSYGSGRRDERGWWDRFSDEVSSWFEGEGDDDRQRRMSRRGKGPKNYTRSDERIREDVNDRLSDNYYLDASDIEVTVENCEVTLNGTVENRQSKRMAEDIAEDVSGVKHVQNNLRVQTYQSGSQNVSSGYSSTSGTSSTGTSATGSSSTGTSTSGTTSGTSTESNFGESSTDPLKGRSANS